MIHGCKKGKQMKHKLLMLSLLTLASAAAWAVPDLKNPALTPVRFEPAPNHAPLKLIEKGKPNFAIVYDKSNRDRAFTSSVERAALLLEEAVEKCTGVKPAVLGLHEQDKAKQYQYKIHLGYNDITKKLGADPFKGPKQGYQLFTCPEGVVIAGYDSALLDQGKKYSPLEPREILRGTLWGACDFAERILGCRWYFPGEYGSIFPKIAELTLPAVRYSDYPRFYNRDGCWIGWSLRGKKKQWEALMGAYQKETDSPNRLMTMQEYWRLEPFMGPKSFHPGHDPEPSRIMKFYPDRKKDIFFTDESGYMRYNPKAHIGNDFDLTNLKFADIIIDAMKKYYASGGKDYNIWSYPPNKRYINIGQCDGEVPDMDMLRNPTVQKLKLISQADFISLHLPLTEETRHLVDRRAFEQMKDGVILINASRGGIVDEKAARAALDTGRLGGLGLDAFEEEPPAGSPLFDCENVIATPHTGAHTREAAGKMAQMAVENLIQMLTGEACPHLVR